MLNQAKWILLVSALGLPFAALAAPASKKAPEVSDPADQMTYAGIGFARVSAGVDHVDDATNLTGVIGVHPKGVNWAAAELELGTTIVSGNVSTGADRHFSLRQGAVFGVLRSPGIVYGMGRIGYQYMSTGLSELSGKHSGTAWSLGGGWRFRPQSAAGAELLYTRASDGIHYWGVRLNYGFGASKKEDQKSDRYLDH